MKNKKMIIILLIIILILAGIGYYIYTKVEISKNEQEMIEYTPEEEITRTTAKTNGDIFILYEQRHQYISSRAKKYRCQGINKRPI